VISAHCTLDNKIAIFAAAENKIFPLRYLQGHIASIEVIKISGLHVVSLSKDQLTVWSQSNGNSGLAMYQTKKIRSTINSLLKIDCDIANITQQLLSVWISNSEQLREFCFIIFEWFIEHNYCHENFVKMLTCIKRDGLSTFYSLYPHIATVVPTINSTFTGRVEFAYSIEKVIEILVVNELQCTTENSARVRALSKAIAELFRNHFFDTFSKKRILDSLLNLERYNIAIRAELMIYILDYTGEWLWYTLTRLNYYFIINKMEQLEVYLDTLPPESLKKWKEHIQIMKQK